MSETGMTGGFAARLPGFVRRDPAVVIAFACIVVLLLVGSLYSRELPVAGIPAAAAQGGLVPRASSPPA